MPSAANPKLEKQASTEAVDNTPIRQAIVVIEHKIRNLEKRKGKLEGYRDLQKSGKELNADQKVAVAKYDEVINTIEFARELIKSFGVISTVSEKEAKKLARKETLQRVQQNVQNIREVLLIQDILSELGSDEVRKTFLAGENGAVLLTDDDFKLLDELYEEITPKRDEAEDPFNTVVQRSAEHIISIIDGKPKEAFGRTYAAIRDLLKKIEVCEYFNQNKAGDDLLEQPEPTEPADNPADSPDSPGSPQPDAAADDAAVTVDAIREQSAPVVLQQAPMIVQPLQGSVSRTSVNAEAPAPDAVPAPAFPPQMAQLSQIPPQVIPQVPPGIVPVVPAPLPPSAALPPHLPTVQSVEHAYFAQQQQQYIQQQQQQQQQRPISEMIASNPAGFYFLQESELDSPEAPPPGQVAPALAPPPSQIPTQTYTNQSFAPPPAQFQGHPPPPQQVPVPELAQHIPGFVNPNPPLPIPMPPSQQTTQPTQPPLVQPVSVAQQIPFINQQPQPNLNTQYPPVQPQNQPIPQTISPTPQKPKQEVEETTDWCQSEPEPQTTTTTNAWHNRQSQVQPRETTPPANDWSNENQEQWSAGQGDGYNNRGGFRGRGRGGNHRGSTNFRGRGGYQQNGGSRSNSGGTYYRNNDQQSGGGGGNSYYQNQNGGSNYNRDGGYGYQGGFKSRGSTRGGTGRGTGATRPGGPRTGQSGGVRGGNRGGSNTQYVRREHTATAAKQ